MNKNEKLYIVGHRGLVGSTIVRNLENKGYNHLFIFSCKEIDLTNKNDMDHLFSKDKTDYAHLAAEIIPGIHVNDTYPADFVRDNLKKL